MQNLHPIVLLLLSQVPLLGRTLHHLLGVQLLLRLRRELLDLVSRRLAQHIKPAGVGLAPLPIAHPLGRRLPARRVAELPRGEDGLGRVGGHPRRELVLG